MDFFFYVAIITLLSGGVILLDFIRGIRKIQYIKDIVPLSCAGLPKISIIIPACNEEKNIEKALQSVLEIDYDPLEIIVINDRSTDATGAILDCMGSRYPRLKVVHSKELPKKWLGKCHALDQGARLASGDYLLFTDADIFFEKTVLRRAINHMQAMKLDHLSLIFGVPEIKGLLGMLMLETMVGLFVILKPWKAKEASKRYFVGVGAFNLVRASTYRECGGHQKIAMCPVDDIMLGKLIKKNGFRQDCLYGQEFVLVEWYRTVEEMIAGLMKNAFAAFDFSIPRVIVASVAIILFGIWPMLSLFIVAGPAFIVNSFLVISRLLFGCFLAHTVKMKLIHTLWALITPYLTFFMIWKAVISTLYHRCITWRGTRYSLKELRSGMYK
jgi:glycosyltransferase involved in cell wall biosynthesis